MVAALRGFSFWGVDSLYRGWGSVIDLLRAVSALVIFPVDKDGTDPDARAGGPETLVALKCRWKLTRGRDPPSKLSGAVVRTMPDQVRASTMLAFANHPLGQRSVKHINGADEGKGGPADIDISTMSDSLCKVENLHFGYRGGFWSGTEPRQSVKARGGVRRFKRRAHRAAPDLQRWLDRPGRYAADKLRTRPRTRNRRRPTACEAQEDCTIDLVALCGSGFDSKGCEPEHDHHSR